ncbi:MAG: peroxide stress protein YaaA [Planctomycetota bacterium]
MLILLSPAKTLDYESDSRVPDPTEPALLSESVKLAEILKKKTPKQLGALMGISDDLAMLNHTRYQEWSMPMPDSGTRPSILAFQGDVYQGLDAASLTAKQLSYAQDHLRILSGLYGILRPFDLMLPYRLEMGTKLKNRRGADLYAFWGDRITSLIVEQLESLQAKTLLNLASNEYFRSVKPKQVSVPIISPVFKDFSNGNYRIISFFAKKARGTMARWVIRNRVKTVKKLEQFDGDGYRYDPDASTPAKPVFLRRAE